MDPWAQQWLMVMDHDPQPGEWIIRGDEAVRVGVFFSETPKPSNDNKRSAT